MGDSSYSATHLSKDEVLEYQDMPHNRYCNSQMWYVWKCIQHTSLFMQYKEVWNLLSKLTKLITFAYEVVGIQ